MNLKIGDKLLCKKNYIIFRKEKLYFYEILNVEYEIINIICEKQSIYNSWYFSLDPNDKLWDYIWDYFYTPQEVRKMKLKKLKQC